MRVGSVGARVGASGAAAPSVAVTVIVRLAVVRLTVFGAHAIAVEPGQDAGEEEEYAIHDAEGEASLEHGARLVDVDVPRVEAGRAQGPQRQVERVTRTDRGAVQACESAHVPNGGDEGADEAEIDDGHSQRVGGRTMVAEDGVDGPCQGDDGDDKHDEDEVGRQRVDRNKAVDEPGQHAHGGNLDETSRSR
jgi:hypothetical protein